MNVSKDFDREAVKHISHIIYATNANENVRKSYEETCFKWHSNLFGIKLEFKILNKFEN